MSTVQATPIHVNRLLHTEPDPAAGEAKPGGSPTPPLPPTREVFPERVSATVIGKPHSDVRVRQAAGSPLDQLEAFDAARVAPPELASQGVVANTLKVTLSGNMHFQDWFEKVDQDASVVVAMGPAYSGRMVKVGREVFPDAALIHYRRSSGFSHEAELTVLGKPGETVELRYVRLVPPLTIRDLDKQAPGTTTSKSLEILSTAGIYAATREDPYFRITQAEIVSAGPQGALVDTSLEHFMFDPYGNPPAFDPKGGNVMGGGASAEAAAAKTYEPAFGFINAR